MCILFILLLLKANEKKKLFRSKRRQKRRKEKASSFCLVILSGIDVLRTRFSLSRVRMGNVVDETNFFH
jgi:hypothetical protein